MLVHDIAQALAKMCSHLSVSDVTAIDYLLKLAKIQNFLLPRHLAGASTACSVVKNTYMDSRNIMHRSKRAPIVIVPEKCRLTMRHSDILTFGLTLVSLVLLG